MTDNSELDSQELSTDVMKTVESLMSVMEDGESPASNAHQQIDTIVTMYKPSARQKIMENPDDALRAVAVINQATSDVLEKHAEKPVDELAVEGLSNDK
jgi:hypothetical protein